MSNTIKKIFCNKPQSITREARWLVFFDKNKLPYNKNLRGEMPNTEDYIFKVRVNSVQKFDRNISHKTQDYNPYIRIKMVEQFYPIKSKEIEQLQSFESRNAYVVFLVTNDDIQVFGNDREPMSFRIEDKISDNASGSDHYQLIVEGETTLKTRKGIIPEETKSEFFKVLLFAPPME